MRECRIRHVKRCGFGRSRLLLPDNFSGGVEAADVDRPQCSIEFFVKLIPDLLLRTLDEWRLSIEIAP